MIAHLGGIPVEEALSSIGAGGAALLTAMSIRVRAGWQGNHLQRTGEAMDTTTATVTRVANVIVSVEDQNRVLDFYTDALGLEKRADVPFGNGDRWIEVAPAGAETPIAICPPGPGGQAGGKDTGITLQTGDIEAYHARLRARGVDVDAEISRMGDPVPPLFWFRDPEGNTLMVVEVREQA